MAALPENWEWDYDGKRWFYRYKPTGLIQYSFPKPGDEFPEFVDDGAARFDLAPEEKLVSQKQIRRRSTLGESSSKQAGHKHRVSSATASIAEQDDGTGPFWLQPDGLMYMGPGAYNDISPLQEEEEAGQETAQVEEKKDTATTTTTIAVAATGEHPEQGTRPRAQSYISPTVSAETTPLVTSSQPATTSPETNSVILVETGPGVAVDTGAAPSPTVPLLDSRQVEAPRDPLGFVAELPSELTAQCREETHPAPVELPSNEVMREVTEPAVYANAFHLAPVELPSDTIPAPRVATANRSDQKAPTSRVPTQGNEQPPPHQVVQGPVHRPYRPARQNSLPQPASRPLQPFNTTGAPTPGKYQPYNPARHAAVAADYASSAVSGNRHSISGIQNLGPSNGDKRHSLAGPAPSHYQSSEVPAILKPPRVSPKQPLDGPGSGGKSTVPVSRTRHQSISGSGNVGNSGLVKVPSVLQPARGRPIRAQSPPENRQGSPNKNYQAYKPYRDLQRDIDDTVQLLSRTGYGQGSTGTPQTSSPGGPKTDTLPTDLPSTPYMGVRPQLPPSVASAPVTLQSLQSHRNLPRDYHTGIAPRREASTAAFQEYSIPLPPSSPDIPEPLNLSRKSPVPTTQDSIPTVNASLRPPLTTEPEIISRESTPAPCDIMIVSVPGAAGSNTKPNASAGSLGSTDSRNHPNTHEGTGFAFQQSQLDTSDKLQVGSLEVHEDKTTASVAISSGELQRKPSEQVVLGDFGVASAPSIPPAPHPAASAQALSVGSEVNMSALTSASVVETIDLPSILQSIPEDSREPQNQGGTLLPHNEPFEVSQITDQESGANQQTAQAPSGNVFAETGHSRPSQPNPTVPDPTPTSSSAHIILDYSVVQMEPFSQPALDGSMMRSTDQTVQAETSTPPHASPALPAIPRHQSSPSRSGLVGQQAVTPSTQTSLTPRVPSSRSPSPLSRAPSPLAHGSNPRTPSSTSTLNRSGQAHGLQQLASQSLGGDQVPIEGHPSSSVSLSSSDQDLIHQQPNVSQSAASVQLPTETMASFSQDMASTTEVSPSQHRVYPLAMGLGPSPIPSQPLVSNVPAAKWTTPPQIPPAGRHPLASHPVDVCPPSPSITPKPSSLGSGTPGAGQAPPVTPAPMALPGVHPSPPQPLAKDLSAAGTSSLQPQPRPVMPQPAFNQATSYSNPMANPGHTGSQLHMPQPQPAAGPVQLPMQSSGRMPPMPIASGQALPVSSAPSQVPANAPHRSFSLMSLTSPPPSHATKAPGTAPPERSMMFSPPGGPQGMLPPQAAQPGALLSRQTFPPQTGMLPLQPGMLQHQSSQLQMVGGPQMMQIQPPRPAEPVKEEKSWFGRLWRSDTVKRSNSVAGGGKLQKQGGRPMSQQPPFQDQFNQSGQVSGQPMLMQGMMPHMTMHYPQQQQNLSPQPPPQLQRQQQGMAAGMNGSYTMPGTAQHGNQHPQPVPPPLHMRQGSAGILQQQHQQYQQHQQQQHAHQLKQVQRRSVIGGPTGEGMSVQQVQAHGGGRESYPAARAGNHDIGSGGGGPGSTTGAAWGNASNYDGSGWGDDFEENYR